MTKPTGKPIGRPRKEIDYSLFERLCKVQGTLEWVAAFLEVSERTLERRVAEHYTACPECGEKYVGASELSITCPECGKDVVLKPLTFDDISQALRGFGKMGVMQKQFAIALKGDRSMLIHLGKNYCGQSEKSEIEVTQKGPLVIVRKSKEVEDE